MNFRVKVEGHCHGHGGARAELQKFENDHDHDRDSDLDHPSLSHFGTEARACTGQGMARRMNQDDHDHWHIIMMPPQTRRLTPSLRAIHWQARAGGLTGSPAAVRRGCSGKLFCSTMNLSSLVDAAFQSHARTLL